MSSENPALREHFMIRSKNENNQYLKPHFLDIEKRKYLKLQNYLNNYIFIKTI